MADSPLVVYIPGLKPKPEASMHREQLLRCLTEGVRRQDPAVAAELGRDGSFELISWTYDFYGEHRDIALDLEDIETALEKPGPSEDDIVVATSLKRRFSTWLFRVADLLPFLIPGLVTEEVQIHLRDFHRYVTDREGRSEAAREKLKSCIRDATGAGRPLLLFAHSMGSVIAYDALWQLSHEEAAAACVDLLVTTGSPLGQRTVQRHLLGRDESGTRRYPANINDWINVAAVGELTAIDRVLANDFAEMIELGLVADIDDRDCFNHYHMDGKLNVHVEYGYLVNEVIARIIGEWWRAKRPASG